MKTYLLTTLQFNTSGEPHVIICGFSYTRDTTMKILAIRSGIVGLKGSPGLQRSVKPQVLKFNTSEEFVNAFTSQTFFHLEKQNRFRDRKDKSLNLKDYNQYLRDSGIESILDTYTEHSFDTVYRPVICKKVLDKKYSIDNLSIELLDDLNILRVIVAGSRDATNVKGAREALLDMAKPFKKVIVLNGLATGGDAIGGELCKELGYDIDLHKANWYPSGVLDRSAGYKRNYRMSMVANHLIALWDGKSKGTKNMIDIMKGRTVVTIPHKEI